ncbi:MAG TPA: DUF885 domain-containing protein [Gemmataceae bacterium]|nr:DUF885 domain-containing protein [Gemmataceae bacterium]
MNHLAVALLLVVLASILPLSIAGAAEEEDAKLLAYFKNYLEEEFRQRPLEATRLGDHRYDDRLDDVSPMARAAWTARYRTTLRQLPERVDYNKLSRSGQIDFEIFQHHLTRSLWMAENLGAFELGDSTGSFELDPRMFNNYITDSVFLVLAQSSLPKTTNVKNCVARMAYIPRVVAAAKESLKNPAQIFVETAIRQNRGAIAFYEHGIFELTGETPQLSELAAAAKLVVACLKEYQEFLEKDLLPRAHGEWRIGKEKFVRKLDLELNAGLSAEQVLRDAESEAARVQGDMYVIARQLWGQVFPKKPLPPDDPEGRRSTILQVLGKVNLEHGRPEDLVRDIRNVVADIKTFIKENDILRLLEPDQCRIIEMPEFQRGNTVAFLNPSPPLDPKASSYYAISPPPKEWDERRVASYLQEYNSHMLPVLSIHEGYPGHYVQLEYSNRHPSFIRKVLSSGVFAEGWAVYTEQMMLDQGYGKGDLALRLNQLKFYLRAVINAILDYKMHCTQLTDEEALKFLLQDGFQTEGEALGKIVRSKQSTCQLSTYFVGRMAFYRLRQQIEREQGDKFDLGRYHEAVLAHGTLPVKYLPELVRARLAQTR